MNSISTLGRYRILAEIGRGGMGMVFRAHDPSLERTVAIKVLAPHLSWEQGAAERFLREARAVARLRHPNIIEIYDVGQDGPNLYFVMPYLEGLTLEQRIERTGKLDVPEVLSIAQQLASALDYAHGEGVVHRDVKPANVLFDDRGRAILTDFGIARIAQEAKLTTTGGLIGSPEYMAPEQILGQTVNKRSDQYALAVVVFESLAGKVPSDADTATAILYKQVHEPPPSLRPLCPQITIAFEAALGRALAKAPEQRYESCGMFVTALAQGMSTATEATVSPSLVHARTPLAIAPENANRVMRFARLENTALWRAIEGSGRIRRGADGRRAGHVPAMYEIAYSPDGRKLAVATLIGVCIHDVETLEEERFIQSDVDVECVAFSPDGAMLALAEGDRMVRLWRVWDGALVRVLEGHTEDVTSVAFSPDGAMLASGSFDCTVRLWRVWDGAPLRTKGEFGGFVMNVVFSPDGTWLAYRLPFSCTVWLMGVPGLVGGL